MEYCMIYILSQHGHFQGVCRNAKLQACFLKAVHINFEGHHQPGRDTYQLVCVSTWEGRSSFSLRTYLTFQNSVTITEVIMDRKTLKIALAIRDGLIIRKVHVRKWMQGDSHVYYVYHRALRYSLL